MPLHPSPHRQPMPQATDSVLQLVRQQVVAHYREAWFLRQWTWPNPDAGHLRLKLPSGFDYGCWTRRRVDIRIRPAAKLLAGAALPDSLRPEVAHVGCWSFDGAEQVAMTDFWVLVLEDGINECPTCVVLPTEVLLDTLRRSAEAGRLFLYFTSRGECFTSPSLQTKLTALVTYGTRTVISSCCLTRYLNAWDQLASC